MRRQITWLVAATTSAVVVAFIVPLCVLVANIAADRATNQAREQAQAIALFVASVDSEEEVRQVVSLYVAQGVRVSVHLPSGETLGTEISDGDEAEEVAMARRTRAAFTQPTAAGIDVVVPVETDGEITVVESSVTNEELRAGVVAAWLTIIGLGALLVIVAIVIARRLGRRISVPVVHLADVAHRIRAGDRGARATVEGPAEAVELARALNQLADRIDTLVVSERESVADLGHRLRTPITALRLDTDLVPDTELAERLRGHVDELQRSVDTVVREARRPLRHSMPGTSDASEVVRARADFWEPLAQDQGREFRVDVPDHPCPVPLASEDVADLVDVLLDNVFAHTPEGTSVLVALSDGAGDRVLTVGDGGPGAGAAAIRRGESGSGSTGLGLDIVRRIAEGAGGGVVLRPSGLGGLEVAVRLPAASSD
jgi:signal transduction histidine kinase